MTTRLIKTTDTENFYNMLCLLDEETEFMIYEPGERQAKTKDLTNLAALVERAVSGPDFLMVAENDDKEIVGFIWGERGKANRMLHTVYIAVGIREAYRGQGIGTIFFNELENWAKANGIVRLELTVECPNTRALHLYEKQGFTIEGRRPKAMKVNGEFVDEYYMGKIV